MKKFFMWWTVLLVVFLAITSVFAQDSEKVSGFVDVRNDIVLPKDEEDITVQSVNIFLKHGRAGVFLESADRSKDHVLTLKPSLLLSKGPWSLLVGAATNSKGADFAQAGAWYINSFGKVNIFADLRNYFSISGQSNGYTDNLFRIMYPITDKISVGAELVFDHWWNDGHNLYLIGPRAIYQFSKTASIYIRVSHEENATCTGTVETNYIRTALMYTF